MKERLKDMETRLKSWRAQIEELEAQAEKTPLPAGFGLRQRIDEIKARCAITQAKIDKLKADRP